MGTTMANIEGNTNQHSRDYSNLYSTNLPTSLTQINDANENFNTADDFCEIKVPELQSDTNNGSRKADRQKLTSRKSTGCLSDALTDTDSYLTADDELTSASDDDECDQLSSTLQEKQFFENPDSVSSAYGHVEEILFCTRHTVNEKTCIDGHDEVFSELQEQKNTAAVGALGVESEQRRLSYQFAIDEFSDVLLNICLDGGEADEHVEEEFEPDVTYDLDPAEFNHRQADYLLGLDSVEFHHPRRETERHESVVEGLRLSTVVVLSDSQKPAAIAQVDHAERIMVRSATRPKLYFSSDCIATSEDLVNFTSVPVGGDSDEPPDTCGTSDHSDEDEVYKQLSWGCTDRPVVEATVCETMEMIRATLVVRDGLSDDIWIVERNDGVYDRIIGDVTEDPSPDYSSSDDESHNLDAIGNVQQVDIINAVVKPDDYSIPNTPEPDYDMTSPASPTDSSGEFASAIETEISQNFFSFEKTAPSNAVEYEDEDNEVVVQTPLDRRGSTRRSLYIRRPTAARNQSITALPQLEDEERLDMEHDTGEITHFGSDVYTERTVDGFRQSSIPLRYDTGPAAVPVVIPRQEREFMSRPLVGPGIADLSGVPLSHKEELRPVNKLNELAKPTRQNAKRKKSALEKLSGSKTSELSVTESTGSKDRRSHLVTLRREQSGFGMTIGGRSPVQIVRVAENGAAMKAGVNVGDKIVKVNGTFVTNWGYEQVNELIKGAGSFVKLDLLPRNDSTSQQDVAPRENIFQRQTTVPSNSSRAQEPLNGSRSPDTGHRSPSLPVTDETQLNSSVIMAMESDEEDDDNQNYQTTEMTNRTEFSNIELLMQKPAHMAVFISFVLSQQRNSASLLFYLMTSGYRNNAKETPRWAQEIFATFLAESAPLRIPVDSDLISLVEATIALNRLEKEVDLFKHMLRSIKFNLEEALAEFRQQRSLGFQGMYGGEQLKSSMDQQEEVNVIESALWSHFINYYRNETDESQAVASVLASYLKYVGYTETKNHPMLASCPTFNTKDKKAFWLKAAKHQGVPGHQFGPLNTFATTRCVQCNSTIWNAFNGGFQCSNCQVNVHKSCMSKLRMQCCGPKANRSKSRANTIINFMPNRISNVLPPSFTPLNNRGSEIRASDDSGISTESRMSITPSISSSASSYVDLHPSSSFSSLSSRHSNNSISIRDPDLIIEPEPPLADIIPKEEFCKLKKSEIKQQQIIHELFYLERKHVSILKMMLLIQQRMSEENWIPRELIAQLFPRLEDLIEVHVLFSNKCKARLAHSAVVHNVADILLEQFSGKRGEYFAEVCSEFIRDQKYVLSELRSKLAKDQRLAVFLQDLCSDAVFQRMELKDFLPQEMQRITRYPMLLDRLIKSTPANTEECNQLTRVMPMIEKIVMKVNEATNERENRRKAYDMDRKLDTNASDKSILTEFKGQLKFGSRTLIRDGDLTWRLSSGKNVTVHVALFADMIVLLQSQEDRLVLRTQNVTIAGKEKVPHSPVIRLNGLMVRENAAEKRVFFLICFNKSQKLAQNYTLVASSTEEKASWYKDISRAISGQQQQPQVTVRSEVIHLMASNSPYDMTDSALDNSTSMVDMLDSNVEGSHVVDAVEINSVTYEHLVNSTVRSEESPSRHNSVERIVAPESASNPQIVELEKVVTYLHRILSEKRQLVSQSLNLPDANFRQVSKAEEAGDESLVALAQLQQLLSAASRGDRNSHGATQESEFLAEISADELIHISTNLHQLIVQLTASAKSTDEENSRLEAELHLARDRLNSLVQVGSGPVLDNHPSWSHAVVDGDPADRSSDDSDD